MQLPPDSSSASRRVSINGNSSSSNTSTKTTAGPPLFAPPLDSLDGHHESGPSSTHSYIGYTPQQRHRTSSSASSNYSRNSFTTHSPAPLVHLSPQNDRTTSESHWHSSAETYASRSLHEPLAVLTPARSRSDSLQRSRQPEAEMIDPRRMRTPASSLPRGQTTPGNDQTTTSPIVDPGYFNGISPLVFPTSSSEHTRAHSDASSIYSSHNISQPTSPSLRNPPGHRPTMPRRVSSMDGSRFVRTLSVDMSPTTSRARRIAAKSTPDSPADEYPSRLLPGDSPIIVPSRKSSIAGIDSPMQELASLAPSRGSSLFPPQVDETIEEGPPRLPANSSPLDFAELYSTLPSPVDDHFAESKVVQPEVRHLPGEFDTESTRSNALDELNAAIGDALQSMNDIDDIPLKDTSEHDSGSAYSHSPVKSTVTAVQPGVQQTIGEEAALRQRDVPSRQISPTTSAVPISRELSSQGGPVAIAIDPNEQIRWHTPLESVNNTADYFPNRVVPRRHMPFTSAMSYAEVSRLRTAGERAKAYSAKLNELLGQDRGFSLWLDIASQNVGLVTAQRTEGRGSFSSIHQPVSPTDTIRRGGSQASLDINPRQLNPRSDLARRDMTNFRQSSILSAHRLSQTNLLGNPSVLNQVNKLTKPRFGMGRRTSKRSPSGKTASLPISHSYSGDRNLAGLISNPRPIVEPNETGSPAGLGLRPIQSRQSDESSYHAKLDRMSDILPAANRATLSEYLIRSDGNDLDAIGSYLADDRQGRVSIS
ncbi:uncharacterized protein L969DRAFT_87573 [Mixia osmundae IAM 14324]|uniref:Uncharacterized protein n=1 Tax=Mixia osmundae (strain CBS 9802 / IAM 14324 / JCM 22182 / KY 12970) TaxID=764103 RepID=G7DVU3_MIXOS|nr:uncharacterized protein L969DRAFT_87573 [Mixia osmundae IAM 14324]KEI39618.1 hypothetical protein L969DRAFT_87573 [Mixia osmundae IAM 14324]GAA94703.1 hypothetical protein E5Q_01356 [Mixia osmundae IAM 14324]